MTENLMVFIQRYLRYFLLGAALTDYCQEEVATLHKGRPTAAHLVALQPLLWTTR